jgi:hypothetical protein
MIISIFIFLFFFNKNSLAIILRICGAKKKLKNDNHKLKN